ncbi:RDD family protein [Streptomyces sp. NPDC004788]
MAPSWPSVGSQPAAPAAASARLGGMPINPATSPQGAVSQGAALPAAASHGAAPHSAAPQAAAPHGAAPQSAASQGAAPHGAALPAAASHGAAPQSAAPHAAPAPWAPQGQSGPAPDSAAPPVVPWKPPVDDVFTSAAREQAAARPAGMGRRLLARIIDGAVFGAAVGAVAYPFVSAALAHIEEKIEAARQSGVTVQVWLVDSTTAVQFGIVLAAFFVLGVVYEVVPTAKWGRTLGKKVCGIQVRDIEAHEPPTFGAALRRWLVYGVLGLLGVGVLNVLWCLFDRPWRQCWHDKAAGTFVAR